MPGIEPRQLLDSIEGPMAALLSDGSGALRDSETARMVLAGLGLAGGGLPAAMAPVLALVEALPRPVSEWLRTELLAALVEPAESF